LAKLEGPVDYPARLGVEATDKIVAGCDRGEVVMMSNEVPKGVQ